MKKVLFFICLIAVISGCKKGQQHPAALTGTWELRSQIGGETGAFKTYQPGNGNTLQFNADSTFKAWQQFSLADHGTFHIIKNGLTLAQSKFDIVSYNHSPVYNAIQMKADTLIIGLDVDDGIAYTYVRQ